MTTIYRFIALMVVLIPFDCTATLSQVMQEPFIGPGTLTASSPGKNFSSVTGSFAMVRVGPSTTASPAPGWSADPQNPGTQNCRGTVQLSGPASLCGMWGAWFRFKNLPGNGGSVSIMQLFDSNATVLDITVNSAGVLSTTPFNYGHSSASCIGPTVPLNTWTWVAMAWQIQPGAGFPYSFRCLSMPLGGQLTTWGSASGYNALGTAFSSVNVGLGNGGGMPRIGCPTLFSMSSFSDITYPSSITPPVEQSYNWYVNPATGNDANDGSTPATAWRTAAQLTLESQYCGLLDSNAPGPGGGDVVTIDTSKAPLPIGTSTLTFATQGLKVQPATGQTYIQYQAEEDLSNAAFTPTPGLSKTYQTTDTQANIVAWQNDKWMWHVQSASYGASAIISAPGGNTTNYPTTGAALDAVPGSFYTDGTTLYIHPFGDTNPKTDGNTYTRSINRGGGLAAVAFTAGNFRAIGFHVVKTTLADQFNNDFGAYCLQDGVLAGSGFSSSVEGGYFAYGDKHCFGSTTGVTHSTLLVLDTECEQGDPYCGFGGQTPFVSFSGVTTADNVHIYRGCTCLARSGLIGSTAGYTQGGDIFLSHNSGVGYSFASITFDDCNFASGSATVSVATNFNIINHTQIGRITTYCPSTNVQETTFPNQMVDMEGDAAQLTVQNSLLIPTYALNPVSPYYGFFISGNVTIEGCTFDLSGISGDSIHYFLQGIIQRTGPLQLTFRNNAYIVPADESLPLLYNATRSDALVFDHNAYNLGAGTTLVRSFNGATGDDLNFSQWQAVGYDCDNSSVDQALDLQNDVPQSGSPLINGGVDFGTMADVTGSVYAHRDTIGAYEGSAAYKAPQSIIGFPSIQSYSANNLPIALPATTTAGLPITYTVISGPAQITGTSLVLTGGGPVVITAWQPGNRTNASVYITENINAVPFTPETPALPPWGIALLGALLALFAVNQRSRPATP